MKASTQKVLELIAKAYNFPIEWVEEAYRGGLESITDIIDYCEARLELEEQTNEENKRIK